MLKSLPSTSPQLVQSSTRQHYSSTWNAWITPQEKVDYLIKVGKLVHFEGHEAMKCGYVASSLADLQEHCKREPSSIAIPLVNSKGQIECPFIFRNVKSNPRQAVLHCIGGEKNEQDLEKEIGDHYLTVARQCYTKAKDSMKKNAKLPWFKKDASFKSKSAFEFASKTESDQTTPTTPATSDTSSDKESSIKAAPFSWAPPTSGPLPSSSAAYLSSISSFLPAPPGSFATKKEGSPVKHRSKPKESRSVTASAVASAIEELEKSNEARQIQPEASLPSKPPQILTSLPTKTAKPVSRTPSPVLKRSSNSSDDEDVLICTPPNSQQQAAIAVAVPFAPAPQHMSLLRRFEETDTSNIPLQATVIEKGANMLSYEELKAVTIHQASQLKDMNLENEQLQREKRKLEYEKEALLLELTKLRKKQKRSHNKDTEDDQLSSEELETHIDSE